MFLRALVAASFIMIAGPAFPQATPETILGLSGPQVCPAVPLTTGWGDNCVPTMAMWDQLFAAKADIGGNTGYLSGNNIWTGTLTIFSPDGSTQTPLGQFVEMSKAYPGLSSVYDPVRISIGGFPTDDEIGHVAPSVSAFTAAISTPSVATGGYFDAAISAYCQGASSTRACDGLFAEAGLTASVTSVGGGGIWAINTETINCENHSTSNCGAGHGFDFGLAYGVEADLSIYSKSGGVAPVGQVFGFFATPYSDTTPTVATTAFVAGANYYPGGPSPWWAQAYSSQDGAATVGLELGTIALSGSSRVSQPIVFNWVNSVGVEVFYNVHVDSLGVLQANGNAAFTNAYATVNIIASSGNPAMLLTNTGASKTWQVLTDGSGHMEIFDTADRFDVGSTAIVANLPFAVTGAVTAASYTVGATPGASCAGALTGSAAVTNGIVTHC